MQTEVFSSLWWIPGSGTVGLLGCIIRNCQTVPTAAAPFCIPSDTVWKLQLPHIFSSTSFCQFKWKFSHSSRYSGTMVLVCFFLITNDVEQLFMCSSAIYTSSLMKYQSTLCLFLTRLFVFLLWSLENTLYIQDQTCALQMSSPSLWLCSFSH